MLFVLTVLSLLQVCFLQLPPLSLPVKKVVSICHNLLITGNRTQSDHVYLVLMFERMRNKQDSWRLSYSDAAWYVCVLNVCVLSCPECWSPFKGKAEIVAHFQEVEPGGIETVSECMCGCQDNNSEHFFFWDGLFGSVVFAVV